MAKKSSVTMKMIAQQLGISTATISRAFNHPEKLSATTRYRIEEAVSANNYQLSNSVDYKEGQIILLIIEDVMTMFDYQLLQTIIKVLQEHHYLLFMASQLDKQVKPISQFIMQQIKGVIQIGQLTRYDPQIALLGSRPWVTIGNMAHPAEMIIVDVDHISAAFHAIDYLCKQGYSRIAYLAGMNDNKVTHLQEQGYRLALQRHNIAYEPNYVMYGEISFNYGAQAAKQLFKLPSIPNAIYCQHDTVAIGVLQQAKWHNFNIPHQLAVIGFGDLPFSAFYQPALTSLTYPAVEIGQKAAKILLDWLQHPYYQPSSFYFNSELIKRATVGQRI